MGMKKANKKATTIGIIKGDTASFFDNGSFGETVGARFKITTGPRRRSFKRWRSLRIQGLGFRI